MSETKWTPGPWIVDWDWPNNKVRGHSAISGAVGRPKEHRAMAQVVTMLDGETYREGEANARLISAAPDMAEALQELLTACLEDFGDPDDGWSDNESVAVGERSPITFGMLRRARSALAKARGET